MFITITGFNHYYAVTPFKVGKKIKCIKEPDLGEGRKKFWVRIMFITSSKAICRVLDEQDLKVESKAVQEKEEI